MSKTFTPGPLYAGRDNCNSAQWYVAKSIGHQPNAEQAGVGYTIATAVVYKESDAVLYAAAPELFAALQEAQYALNDWAHYGEAMRAIGRGHEAHSKSGMGPTYLAGYIAATIAKAVGESEYAKAAREIEETHAKRQAAKREAEQGAGKLGIAIAIGKAGAL